MAKRFTYRDSDEKVEKVESGTVSCITNCHTAILSLTVLQTADTAYDSRRNPIREKISKDSTTFSVTDRSFLDCGLNQCTTARMNLASLPSTTDPYMACTLGTPSPTHGDNRITKNYYDNAGQLLKVQKAYLTADQADYVTYTYTLNGKQQHVTDANGNKAQFEYDGFDRLYRWYFPSKTTPGQVNTADYEQYGYDAAGNRICMIKRDGSILAFGYDGLNRMTSKTMGTVCAGDSGGGGGGGGNSPPVAVNDQASLDVCDTGIFGVVGNDTDPDGDPLSIKAGSVSGPVGFSQYSDTEIRYRNLNGQSGTYAATYVVQDSHGGEDSATLTVTVVGGPTVCE